MPIPFTPPPPCAFGTHFPKTLSSELGPGRSIPVPTGCLTQGRLLAFWPCPVATPLCSPDKPSPSFRTLFLPYTRSPVCGTPTV